MEPSQKRKAVRYAVRMPCKLNIGRRAADAEIVDAGFGGVFVSTDLAPGLRQLVQLQTSVGQQSLSFHAMVVHVVSRPEADGRPCGVGVQFYGVDAETRAIWDQFVRTLEASGNKPSQPPPARMPQMPSPMRRRFLRHAAVLKVTSPDVDSLRVMHGRELSSGRMFVPCDETLFPGNLVFVHIQHPAHTATFLLEGVVESAAREQASQGVIVKLLGLRQERKLAFLEFIETGLDTESEVGDDTPTVELGVSELLESELEEYENLPDSE